MATAAKTTFATLLQYGDGGSPDGFTTLAEVRSLESPDQVAEPIDATTHDSAAAEVIPGGLTDNNEISVEANFTADATAAAVRAKLGGAAGNWQICFPNFGVRNVAFTANVSTDVLTATTHGLTTGQPVRVSSTVTLPPPLVAGVTYYAHWLSADTLTLHATNATAVAGTDEIDITNAGSGTHTLQIGWRLDATGLVTNHSFGRAVRGQAISLNLTLRLTGAVTVG